MRTANRADLFSTGNRWLRWILVVGWMVVIFVLSGQAKLPHLVPSVMDEVQNIAGHFAVYAILAALLYNALAGTSTRRRLLFVLLIVLLYAISDEFHQSFIPNRHPDPFDVATDVLGAGAALFVLNLTHSLRSRLRRR